MRKLVAILQIFGPRRPVYRPRVMARVSEPPLGFVLRSDPNFYFLARKF
jgi:hypothetical protein